MTFLAVIGFIALFLVRVLLSGFVLSVLWRWFVVPPFGLPELTVAQALGIALVVNYVTRTYTGNLAEKEGSAREKLVHARTEKRLAGGVPAQR